MVRVSGSMEQNGAVAVAPQPSLSNMSFGPTFTVNDDDDDASFIVVERMTREDSDKIENELAASTRGLRVEGEGNLGDAVAFNFGEAPSAPGPSGTEPNGELLSNVNASFSLPSDVQQRMDSLIQDNTELQVTVDQTNMALRQMMLTLTSWREDNEKLRQDHKEKFQETRNLVLKLKKEKAEMRTVIEELQRKIEEVEAAKPFMPSLFEAVGGTAHELELHSSIDDLKSQLQVAKAAHEAEKEKSSSFLKELTDLKKNMSMLQTQLQQFGATQQQLVNCKKESENLTLELEDLREENMQLKNDVQNLCSVERHSQNYQSAQAKGFTERIDELTVKLLFTEEQLRKTEHERDNLQGEPNISDAEPLSKARSTVDRLRLRIDEMTAAIVALEQQNEDKGRDILRLEGENEGLQRQNEAIGILQAQVDVYRADFIAERDAREKLAGEKEQLAEDLRRIHRLNLQLMEQEHQQENRAAPVAAHPAPGNSLGQQDRPEAAQHTQEMDQPNSIYRCPICQLLSFRTLQSLNEHIDHCLVPAD